MKRPLAMVVLPVCFLSACATSSKTETQTETETQSLASDILRGRNTPLTCGPQEVSYCATPATRIRSESQEQQKRCACVPSEMVWGSPR